MSDLIQKYTYLIGRQFKSTRYKYRKAIVKKIKLSYNNQIIIHYTLIVDDKIFSNTVSSLKNFNINYNIINKITYPDE